MAAKVIAKEIDGKKMNISKVYTLFLVMLFCCSLTVYSYAENYDSQSLHEIINKAEQDDAEAQYNLAWRYLDGEGVPQDNKEAVKWFAKGLQGDDPFVRYDIFKFIKSNESFKEKSKWLKQEAEQGNTDACYLLGYAYKFVDFKEAAKWFRKAADQGHAEAQYSLSQMYLSGKNADFKEAAKWLRKAGDQGHAEAQYGLGIKCYQEGKDQEAVKWFRKAAEQGHEKAQHGLGIMRYQEKGYQEAAKWFRKAAKQHYTEALFALGELYFDGEGVPQDRQEATKWFRAAAEQGYAPAEYMLGQAYYHGNGVSQDKQEATKWLSKAAEQRYTPAIYMLGSPYYNGKGVPQDYHETAEWFREEAMRLLDLEPTPYTQFYIGVSFSSGKDLPGKELPQDFQEAVKWFRKAAERGHVEAQYKLAWLYREGKGAVQDYQEAANWYRKAAEQGHADAQESLGEMYYQGGSYKEAVKWFWESAKHGKALAQYNLGVMYASGEGVVQNEITAYALWSIAAIEGYTSAKKNRDIVAQELSKQEIKQGREVAADLQRKIENKEFFQVTVPDQQITTNESKIAGSGSAFFITKNGYIITCYHVVDGASKITVFTGDKEYPAKLIRTDKYNDIALLKIDGFFPALSFAPRNSVKMGSDVYTIGFPNPLLQGVNQKLTEGNINALTGYQDDIRLYQISVPVQPGNSGGALLDDDGNVVGIIVALLNAETAFKVTGSLPQNVNYALKSNYVQSLIEAVPEAVKGLQKPHRITLFGDVVERVKKSVVMVLAYK